MSKESKGISPELIFWSILSANSFLADGTDSFNFWVIEILLGWKLLTGCEKVGSDENISSRKKEHENCLVETELE